jgi:hypothetical protein
MGGAITFMKIWCDSYGEDYFKAFEIISGKEWIANIWWIKCWKSLSLVA